MTTEDFEQLQRVVEQLPPFDSVGVFSPLPQYEKQLFPQAEGLPRWRWDLNKPSGKRFDLLVACNVFLCSPDPARWFRHVLASCKYFLMIDPVRRRRTEVSELGDDCDAVRYSVGQEEARIDSSFPLESLGDRLLAHRTYFGGKTKYDDETRHVIALFRGDLAEPTVRIDDYPTGVRPILDDLSPIHRVLERFERARVGYNLGIVPALLDDEMIDFLRRLEYMKPVMHGYDHSYPHYSAILKKHDDPYNEGTVGTFDEFSGASTEEIATKLAAGRNRLEAAFGRPVTTYIPPCNRAGFRTGKALARVGFTSYMSERRIWFCDLPHVRSDFYGRSNEFDVERQYEMITLHTTWEWDVWRKGNHDSLDRLVEYVQQKVASGARVSKQVRSALGRSDA